MTYSVVTNRKLYQWKIRSDDLCTFCNRTPEKLVHLLIECDPVAHFWDEVEDFIKAYVNLTDTMDFANTCILFNTVYPQRSHIFNLIILMAKQFIYRNRCLKGNLNISVFTDKVYKIHSYEKNSFQNGETKSKHYGYLCSLRGGSRGGPGGPGPPDHQK